ncbi:helix-turn-helix domain-containing protein [Ectobacillus sp. JY-23]|uniref:helix-turn-helix domain-containing protein n=1 Tax=Ectobacillus sp. JY-23 TaxID=2933872 RepID=UPI001FF13472|nr:helix-turn-helix transcriptional regulator [Ectobacillus sp. JY-23]UOY92872.1 helix-turn-helix domain-containing protein [Ectobacillus sp. JY-23]
MELKDRLRELRKKHKLTQKDVADFLGISESGYGYYEQGRNEPPLESIKRLAKKYDVPVNYIIAGDDENKPYDSLAEITAYIEKLGITSMSFFDIDKWKNLSPEDVEELKKHFDYVLHKAMERKRKQEK